MIPCKDCICLSICKSMDVVSLRYKCSMLAEYIEVGPTPPEFSKRMNKVLDYLYRKSDNE